MPLIQSVERALSILNLFDEYSTELKITEISERMHIHKSTVHSLLKTLQKYGYIQQDSESGKYRLGIKLFERGNIAIRNRDIRTVAKKYLLDLSKNTGFTLHLAIIDGKECVYIDKVEGASAHVLHSRIGRRVSIHSSGVGKALVAFKANEEVAEHLEGYEFEKRTPNTIVNKVDFLKELVKIQEQGYAVDNEENELGISCIAVPIRDHSNEVVAAFSISMPTPQLDKEQLSRLAPIMVETGRDISEQLGYHKGL